MAVQAHPKTGTIPTDKYHGLQANDLIRMYRLMYCSRRLDDREIELKRQHKIFFQISGAGHEAVTAVPGVLLRPDDGWACPSYRERALARLLVVTPSEVVLQCVDSQHAPPSRCRQMQT